MYTPFANSHTQTQNTLTTAVHDYYNEKRDDRNLLQATDGYVHHHFGLGPIEIDLSQANDQDITNEIQRQENKLADHLISCLCIDESAPTAVIDAGCGRGGTLLRLADQYDNAKLAGVTISSYQADFCNSLINERGLNDRAEVRHANFLSIPYADNTFTHAYCSEVTQYALDLRPLFKEISRVVSPGGTFAIATWCFNDDNDTSSYHEFIEPINDHYASTMHGFNEYISALEQSGFNIKHWEDRTEDLIPYWELRQQWSHKSGIEDYFVDHHKTKELLYRFIIAEVK